MPSNLVPPYRRLLHEAEEDPLSGIANLFDVVMVFAVALLLTLLARTPLLGEISPDDAVTVIKNAGRPDMEIILQDTQRLEHFKVSENQLQGQGERLGVAYRLQSGEVVYVPSAANANQR